MRASWGTPHSLATAENPVVAWLALDCLLTSLKRKNSGEFAAGRPTIRATPSSPGGSILRTLMSAVAHCRRPNRPRCFPSKNRQRQTLSGVQRARFLHVDLRLYVTSLLATQWRCPCFNAREAEKLLRKRFGQRALQFSLLCAAR